MAPKEKAPAKGSKAAVEKKVKKAQAVGKALKKPGRTATAKARYTVRFRRPRTLKKPRTPKAPRLARLWAANPIAALQRNDKYRVLQHPVTTESAMKKIEETNTLVFLCDPRASKRRIKEAVKETYGVVAQRVNTLIRVDGKKKAYVRLTPEFDALDVANKIGII
ncbi:ribosomal protein L23a, putative [Eimeria tenella]|uniref:Ribosomal protein L23a, putative n=1 Tax=Eimeria tenella TaxID=5802 RepID=U6KSR1_EIMTE|nr:ribosomal protein L23a, putative [Eimeria tenella]CDJ41001.1 ribosomal protein L23a, putative [Eimeria tenella]|eukprot:XP_013231751.1 ribosomal protein L23a, putative [Eimeria tenella]